MPATCSAQGVDAFACSRCPERNDTATALLGHDYTAVVTPPTCTAGGFTTHTCARCENILTDTLTARRGHWYGDWSPDGDGTHSADCVRGGCAHRKKVQCSPQEYQLNGKTITLCPVCGGTSTGEPLLPVEGAGAEALTGVLPRGEFILRQGALGDGTGLLSISFEQAGILMQPEGIMRYSLPAGEFSGYTFRLIGADGSADDLPFTLSGSVLTFELDFTPEAGMVAFPAVLIQLIPPGG